MTTALIATGEAILLFLCLYLGFRTGLRLGMQTARGQVPPKLRNPVEVVKQFAEEEKPDLQSEMLRGYANMLAFTGELPQEKR